MALFVVHYGRSPTISFCGEWQFVHFCIVGRNPEESLTSNSEKTGVLF
jgi:hypothetical protein